MPTARRFHAAVVGGDGKIYAIAGEGTGGPTALVERFDESTQQWEAVAPLPLALVWPAAAKDRNGDIWVFGGGPVATGAQEVDTVFKYKIRSNRWSLVTQMPETRLDPSGHRQRRLHLRGLRSVARDDPEFGSQV